MCARYFFFKYQSLPRNITLKIRLSKPYSNYSIFENSVRFLINVERDEFGVRSCKASPFANPVLTPF